MNTVGRDDFAGSTNVSTSFLNRSDESPLGEDVHQATAASPLTGEVPQQHRAYWQRKLAGAPSLLELPTDRPRPARQNVAGEQVTVLFDAAFTRRLKNLSIQHDLSVRMLVLAAWSIVLSRLSGQHDIVIGTSTVSCTRADREPLLGRFVNTQSLRVQVAGTLTQFLRVLREDALDAHTHQDLTFEQLLALIDPPRSPSHAPIFQVVLRWQQHEEDALALAHSPTSPNEVIDGIVEFDLALHLNEAHDRITGELTYATALFDRATIERQVGYLRRVLQAMIDDATQAVDGIELLDIAERQQLLLGGSAMRADYPQTRCVHQLFDAQVARTPNAIAVMHGVDTLSYAELDRQANHLAHHLLSLGVKPNDRVAICAERSVAFVLGMLATLKAGAAYVPLDPNHPAERLTYLLGDCAAAMLLTQGNGREATAQIAGYAARLDLQQNAERWASYPDSAPERDASLNGESLAYVMYTSGSTGMPKGVEIAHRAIARVVLRNGYADFNASDRVAFAANPAFDASTLELWAPLLNGGTLVVIDQAVLLDPQRLAQVLIEQAVTVMWFTVGLFNQYAVQLKQVLPQLRYLLVGGDVLDPGVIGWVMRECPPQHVINGYGPTETTTFATTYEITADPEGKPIPIGRPIAQTQIYILDAQRKLVPHGAVGEIYIGGAGVAHGYLNRPELTEQRFLPNPFVQGGRIYQTGDLGRWLPDGTIEYRGRNDFQVKIRGFRIELGEIEARLTEHAAVHEAVVLAREDAPGEKQLVAYLTWAAHTAPTDIEALRAHLASALPAYMVPAAYVVVETFPLTLNGKLDRKALPAPDADAYVSRAYEAPVGEIEQALAQIWSELLKLERIGRQDHFFELGGHSLLAVRMLARIRNVLQRDLQANDVFAKPLLADLAVAIAQSNPSQQSLIAKVPRDQALPLSFAQQRLWFLAQMEGGSQAYHIPLALHLSGALDCHALQRALDRIVARHEALRTRFVRVGGQPLQRVASAGIGFALHKCSLNNAAPSTPAAQLHEHLLAEANAPFDLEHGPLIRGQLIRLDVNEHVLAVTMHHIVSDGWSMGVLADELSTLYGAYARGENDPLAPLSVHYADYAVWQRDWLSGDVLAVQSAYWQRALTGAPALLELPTDRPRPAQQSYAGDRVPVTLDAALTQKLRGLAQRHGVTLYMMLLAAWSVVLSRLSGQHEIVIGTPTANRARTDVEPLIGFFVNTQALRIDVSGSWIELLQQVKNHALEAQRHQDLPFEQVVERINPPRSLAHTPIFQVMLAWQNNDTSSIDLAEVKTSLIEVANGVVKFDLELHLDDTTELVTGELKYATSLFDQNTIERHVGYLHRVVEALADDSSQTVDRIDLLDASERQQVLVEWNATQADYPQALCIHDLFEAQVTRSPNAIAVAHGTQLLSYAALNAQSNQLAHYLIDLGVRPDDRVAICVERGISMVVGILAILKAGGAYVSLDPNYPADRLAYIVDDCQPVVLLTSEGGRAALAAQRTSAVSIDLQRDTTKWQSLGASNPDRNNAGLTSANLAYIIYTSGSTGMPKGVMIEHRQAVNFLSWAQQAFDREAFAHSLFSTSLNFDLSVYECFAPLTVGGCIHIVSNALGLQRDNPPVRLINTVPSALQAMLDAQAIGDDIRVVNVAGEPLKRELAERLFAQTKVQQLNNLYGPSETTTYSSGVSMPRETGFIAHIGRPLANTQFYLLDAQRQPVPAGAVGEIYIGGAGVARGYLNRPELTEERFLPNPFLLGERIYKTGDIGRWLPDGSIEYRGRNDFQVKIRGFRIELGEIEARLAEHPDVREAVVLAREDHPGDKRLVAYVTAMAGSTLSTDALGHHLSGVLPDYMLPAAYIVLGALPLTPNGKLDRNALPAPATDAYASRAYAAPSGEVEQTLAQIWSEVLKIEQVGRYDHFFALGGHSLMAVTVISRLQSALQLDVSVKDLFARPVLCEFAQAVAAGTYRAHQHIAAVSRDAALPLSFAQQRLWFLAHMQGGSEAYHIPLGLRLKGALHRGALKKALDHLVWRHEALRTCFVREGDQTIQRIVAPEVGFTLRYCDWSAEASSAQTAHLQQRLLDEARAPFDLEHGPLIRGQLIRLNDADHVLAMTMHHIVTDGWSIGVLKDELSQLYAAYCMDRHDPLPPLPIHYADYAVWQRQWLRGEVLEQQSAYWQQTLQGAPTLLELPTDRPRPAQQNYACAIAPVELDATLTKGLKQLSQRHGVTLYMTVLAAWSVVLSRLSGQMDVVIGSPMANRNHAQIESLIGLFVNTQALRLQVSGSLANLLQQTKARALDAQAHQDLPFEHIVERVKAPRSLSHTPIFQVMLTWQNHHDGRLDLPGLTTTPIDMGYAAAKVDLELELSDVDDGIQGGLSYATALFDSATMARHIGYLHSVLHAMVADAEQAVAQVELLSAAERQLLLQTWNATATDYPRDVCLHDLIEAQVARAPDAIAVVCESREYSYAELNRRANRLARHLQTCGVKPDRRVALCMERSLEMVVAILAVVKAGGAYVPLDPDYPADRLQHMLADSDPSVVLVDDAGRQSLAQLDAAAATSAPQWHLHADAHVWNALSDDNIDRSSLGLLPQHLAYVIYTSGSTGKPKGVMNEHAGVVNRLLWMQHAYGLHAGDAVLQKTPYSFDVSVWEFFWTLMTGARLVMARPQGHKDPSYLGELIRDAGVTTLHFVPSMLQVFLAQPDVVQRSRGLVRVICSGEALPVALVRSFHEQLPQTALHNLYGPTEAAIDVSAWTCIASDSRAIVPIGKPIANTQLYVLDTDMQPVPQGVTGELHIGGVQVARGYLNLPALTAERFVRDPFSDDAHARLYKTGDLARWLADGSIEYLGRNDFQVKIRGFRIELGEIEARLAEHAAVREAVVVAREDRPGDKRLVAYVTTAAASLPNDALRTHLSEVLPDYMVPAAYIVLDELPLSLNGKLDRRALPAPESDAYIARTYEAPVGAIESHLAEIWAEILTLDRVGRHDNFFELGGHSLLALTLIERMRRADLPVDVRDVFTTSSLMGLAAAVSQDNRAIDVPPNRIARDCAHITPAMLPLVALSQADIDTIVASVPGGAANVQDIYPLAPLQEGFLFHHLLEDVGDVYLTTLLLAAESRDQLEQYAASLQMVADRHDILRTSVFWEGMPEPVQVVWRRAPLQVEHVSLDPAAGDIAAQLSARFDPRHYRLDVRKAPMLRLFIAEDLPNRRWVVLQIIHHLVDDRSTMELMRQELQAIRIGQLDRLPEPLPFRDFVARVRLGVAREEQEAFFTRMLGDVDEPTLPFGLADVQGDGSRIVEAHRAIDEALGKRLRANARTLKVSVASICHLAWALVLARACGRDDVVFGTVMFGRMQGGESAERMMGTFINTLPLRLRIDDEGVQASVRKTHALLSELLRYEHAPLALAQRCSAVQAPAPLFTGLLNYRYAEEEYGGQDRSSASSDAIDAGHSESWAGLTILSERERINYPFGIAFNDLGERFSFTAQVDRSVNPGYVCAQFENALEELVAALEQAPATPLRSLDILPVAEWHQLLTAWNATQARYAQARCVHQLFEAQVAHAPDAIALIYQSDALSYGELNARANRLAHHLIGLGVKPDDRVAICVERSVAMVVGILAILKAGGAYVPLDTTYPSDRLAYVLGDAAPALVLADAAGRAALGDVALAARVVVDPNDLPATSERNPVVSTVTSRHLAYVIYTSGSTGTPKGVMVEHRGVVNFLASMQQTLDFGSNDRLLATTSISFDIAGLELYLPLSYGALVVLASRSDTTDPHALHELIATHHISVLQATPAAWRALLDSRDAVRLNLLALCGGEAMPPALAAQLRKAVNKVWNLYGPTEATIWSTAALVDHNYTDTAAVSIGRPIANTQIYVLDAHGRPVPTGAMGELYIGGAGLARGYWNRDELTAERFVANPFETDVDARMYKTGDLARYLPDGRLEYLGRNDHQVKIRGFRIELGEIEARLTQHADVREAVVLAREDSPGDKRLVAYITANEGTTVATDALRTHLRAVLPEYMVPAAYVSMDALPLTPNGKLDRKALPAPGGDAFTLRGYEAPADDVESALAQIWADLLRQPRIGRRDNFFELGGHSLLAVTLLSRLRQRMQVDVSLKELFAHPVLAEFAQWVKQAAHSEQQPVVAVPRGEPLALSFSQQRLWFLSQMAGTSEAFHIPAAFYLEGQLVVAALKRALNSIVSRHEALRTRFIRLDGQTVQHFVAADVGFALQEIDLCDCAEPAHEAEQWLADGAGQQFDLEHGPLIRGQLIRLADTRYVLSITVHHIVSDGWSTAVFAKELSTLYRAYSEGQDDSLPPLPVQYADFAVWQRQWLSGDVLQRQTDYWRNTLQGATTLLELPTDRPRPQQQSFAGGAVDVVFDAALTRGLKTLARHYGMTLYMVVLAGWAAVLSRLSGQDDVVIGSPIAGRARAEVEDLIGYFGNMQALRVAVPDSLSELLERVKTRALDAQEHQDLPIEQVIEAVKPPRNLSHTPIFQVMLIWQNTDEVQLQLPGVTVQSTEVDYQAARFDLELELREVGERIVGGMAYAKALFDRGTVARHVGYLRHMLQAMVDNDQNAVSKIDLLDDLERHQLLVDWNDTQVKYRPRRCAQEFFEEHAARAPDAIAVAHLTQTLSYGELNRRANRLAHYLIALGVKPDQRVAICMERSVEMVVGILAILKAGGGYVPLDPNYPRERLDYMLADAAPSVVLTQERLKATLPDSAVVVAVDSEWNIIAGHSDRNPDPAALGLHGEHLAYVIYTSGSTGQPKGVMVEHRQLINLVYALERGYALTSQDRFLQFAALSFDMSVEECFGALCAGSTLVLRTDEWIADAATFWRYCTESGVTVMNLPTAFWHHLASDAHVPVPSTVRQIMVGGEKINPEIVARWFSRGATLPRLINAYGPTETTVNASVCDITDAEFTPRLIGRPIVNTQIYILDMHRQPVPLGTAGELYIGGASVARGYLNRPEQTAERFLTDPFNAAAGARMYRTGDVGRFRHDGSIEYLGRNDHQVKIRGFRIELGEIEACLGEHADVREAVVLAREDSPGDKRLVAYVTAAEHAKLTVDALRAYVRGALPEYMVPAAYVKLDAFPLTPNGKLDRQALPAPEADAYVSRAYEAPIGAVEQRVAQIWAEVLKLERVGRQDNFFELGGHSLLAVTMIERMRRANLLADVRSLFITPTLAAMAASTEEIQELLL